MTAALWPSAFVAAIFAVHPLHVESVAWIAERKDVLSTFFWMLTVARLRRLRAASGVAPLRADALVYALALMSKPMVVTLPVVLLLLDVWPLRRLALAWPTPGGEGTPPGRIFSRRCRSWRLRSRRAWRR